MGLTVLTIDDIYGEIADIAREQGVSNQEMWNDAVEEVVENHLDLGEIDMDEDTEAMKEILRGRWPEYKIEAALEEADDEEEDKPVSEKEEEDEEDNFGYDKADY